MWRSIPDYDGEQILINVVHVERIRVVRQPSAPDDVFIEFASGERIHSNLNYQETNDLLDELAKKA